MDYETEPLMAAIVSAVAARGSFTDRMMRVIDECARQKPHPDWHRMRRIAFQSDEPSLEEWLPDAFEGLGTEVSIRGLWFGLNNPAHEGMVTADVYVGASESYDSESLEWATEIITLPGLDRLVSNVLDALYTEAYGRDGGLENDAEYPLVLAYGAMCALESVEKFLPAGVARNVQGAACGFDSGDALFLGQFQGQKFVRNVVVAG